MRKMEDNNSVFTSNVPFTCYDTTELYGLLQSDTVIPILHENRNPEIIIPSKTTTEKTYLSKKTSTRKVKTVAQIRKEYEQEMIADNLPSDLEKQHNYFIERVRHISFRDEHVYDRTKSVLKSSSPILRSTWPVLTSINVEGLRYSRQYVIWNEKTVLLHGSRGGSTEYLHNFDIGIKTAGKSNQINADKSKYEIPTLCVDKMDNSSDQEMLDIFPNKSLDHWESESTLDNCNMKEVNAGALVCSNTHNEEDISDVLSGEWKNCEYGKNQGNQYCTVKYGINVKTFMDDLSKTVERRVSGKDIINKKNCHIVQMQDTTNVQNNTFTAIRKCKSLDLNILNSEKNIESSKLDCTCKCLSLNCIPNQNNNIKDCFSNKCKRKIEDGNLVDGKNGKASDSKCIISPEIIIENKNFVNSSNDQMKCLKNLSIPLLRINCLNVEPLCMEHELYRCFCKGTFLKNLSNYNTCQETLNDTADDVPNSICTKKLTDKNKYFVGKIDTHEIFETEKKDCVNNSSTVNNKNIKYETIQTCLLNETEQEIKTEIIEFEHKNVLGCTNGFEEKVMPRENLKKYTNFCSNNGLNDILSTTPDCHTTSQSTVPKDCSSEFKDDIQSTAKELKPDNASAKYQFSLWIKQEYDHLKHRLDRGQDIVLGKPHPNKIILFPYTLLLTKYKFVKNYFLVNRQPPHRVYIVINPMHENFKHCVNVENIDIGKSFNKHCEFVKHLRLQTPLKNYFTLLKGLDNAWEVLGLLSKHNDNNNEATLPIPKADMNAEYTRTFDPQNDNDAKKMLGIINHTYKWHYMEVGNDFSAIEFPKRNVFVKHDTIISAIEMANSSNQTVYISFSKTETQKKAGKFGIYIPPTNPVFNENHILIGPYYKQEDVCIRLKRNNNETGICTRESTGIWITTETSKTINEIIKALPALTNREVNGESRKRLKKKNERAETTKIVRKGSMAKPYYRYSGQNPQNSHKMHAIKTETTLENASVKSALDEFPVVGVKSKKSSWTYSAIPNHTSHLYRIPRLPIITTVGTLVEKNVRDNVKLSEHHSNKSLDVEMAINKTESIVLSKYVKTPADNSIMDTPANTDPVELIDENKITEKIFIVSTQIKVDSSLIISSEVDILNKNEIAEDPSIILQVEVPHHKNIKEDCLIMDVLTGKVEIIEENENGEDHSMMNIQVLAEEGTIPENKMAEDHLIMNTPVPTEVKFLDENKIENDYSIMDTQNNKVKIIKTNETEKGNSVINTEVLRDEVEMLEDNETAEDHSKMNKQVLAEQETFHENKMVEDNIINSTQPTEVELLDENEIENDYAIIDTLSNEVKIVKVNETENNKSIMNIEVLTDKVEMLEDNETGDNHSTTHSLKTYEVVKIVCTNVKCLGCIQGRRDSENKISFFFPGRPYSAFYSEDRAFARMNLLFSRNMYIQKPFFLRWKVVRLDLMENKTRWITKWVFQNCFITWNGFLRLHNNDDSITTDTATETRKKRGAHRASSSGTHIASADYDVAAVALNGCCTPGWDNTSATAPTNGGPAAAMDSPCATLWNGISSVCATASGCLTAAASHGTSFTTLDDGASVVPDKVPAGTSVTNSDDVPAAALNDTLPAFSDFVPSAAMNDTPDVDTDGTSAAASNIARAAVTRYTPVIDPDGASAAASDVAPGAGTNDAPVIEPDGVSATASDVVPATAAATAVCRLPATCDDTPAVNLGGASAIASVVKPAVATNHTPAIVPDGASAAATSDTHSIEPDGASAAALDVAPFTATSDISAIDPDGDSATASDVVPAAATCDDTPTIDPTSASATASVVVPASATNDTFAVGSGGASATASVVVPASATNDTSAVDSHGASAAASDIAFAAATSNTSAIDPDGASAAASDVTPAAATIDISAVDQDDASAVALNVASGNNTNDTPAIDPDDDSTAAPTSAAVSVPYYASVPASCKVRTDVDFDLLQSQIVQNNIIRNGEFIEYGSAPNSVTDKASPSLQHIIRPPGSAPLPINPQSLELDQIEYIDSPIRNFTPISGIESSQNSSDNCFSDSSSSWIPDSDEDIMMPPHYRRRAIVEETDESSTEKQEEIVIHELPVETTSTNRQHIIDRLNLTRWKTRDPSKAKRNVSKNNKHNCLPYESKTGKMMCAKLPKPTRCDHTCRYKCSEEFDEQSRITICKEYWGMNNYKQQKDFLLKHIKLFPTKRITRDLPPERHRKSSRIYKFYKNETQSARVCKSFFMATLSISAGPIENAVKGIGKHGTFSGKDRRGRHTPSNKTKPEQYEDVKNHIASFPTMESHYCRKSSKRLYLDSNLSISKMYSLNKENMDKENKDALSLSMYKKISGTEFNLSFFRPKKDQCALCNKYKKSVDQNPNFKEDYDAHISRKESANKAKEDDKIRSNEDPTFISVTLDLQSILQIPMNDIGPLYYSRKLNVQNLTIYESKLPNRGFCILWSELNGKRGSVEIATAIDWWVRQLPKEIKEVSIFSDTCAGQNRNQYIATFFAHLVQSTHLDVIEEKYLESGHSCMEVDSMHSAIEHEQKYTPVYSMIDWKSIMMRARSKRNKSKAPPYVVNELTYDTMLDVKALTQKFMKNRNISNDEGNKVQWLKIKCMKFEKRSPGVIKYHYDHKGPYFELDITRTNKFTESTGNKAGLPRATRSKTKEIQDSQTFCLSDQEDNICDLLKNFVIPKAYNGPLPISQAKKKDLMTLCKKGIIPNELHRWYEALPISSTLVETLPEPDAGESEFEN